MIEKNVRKFIFQTIYFNLFNTINQLIDFF